MKHEDGFTLVELLLVVGLVGLLLVWAMPQFLTFNRRRVLLGATEKLVADLKTAQNLAESGSQGTSTRRFLFRKVTGVNNQYTIVREPDSGPDVTLQTKTMESPTCLARGIFEVGFNMSTGTPDTATTYTVCFQGASNVGSYDVTVEAGGRVYHGDRLGDCSSRSISC